MKTARTVISLGLSWALLAGPGASSLSAQTSPATSSPAGAQASPAPTATTPAKAAPATGTAASAAPAKPAAAAPVAAETFTKEQLEQLVAPIALYSDSLLMQILMAATYPLEVVAAERFTTANPELKGTKLEEALKEEDWDPAVKSLCTVPEVLKKMSQNLDWMQDLGDAFLGQQSELLDTVQTMRGKANDSGNLKTSEQQVVTVTEEKIIVIESPNPEVVYVPTYSPTMVYGGWAPPYYYYPPMYPYYPVGAGLVTFGVGIAVGAALWGGCHWGWGRGNVYINHNSFNNFNRNTNINHNNLSGNRGNWNHNASHRGGVNYKSSSVANQYGAKSGTNRVSQSSQARGRSGSGTGSRQAGAASASAQGRQGSGQRAAGTSAASGNRAASGQKASGARSSSYSGSSGRSAYSGSSRPSSSSYSSSRGSYSRGSMSYGGSRGGYRGGGGGRRR